MSIRPTARIAPSDPVRLGAATAVGIGPGPRARRSGPVVGSAHAGRALRPGRSCDTGTMSPAREGPSTLPEIVGRQAS